VGIVDWCSIGVKFAFGVDRCGNWLAGSHTNPLKDIFSVAILSEMKSLLCSFDINAEKETECPHVPNCEL